MRNLVLINNSYSTFGGEDSNFVTEYENLSKYFNVIKFSLKNEEKITLKNFITIFFSNNYSSNKALSKLVDNNEIEVAYVHNTWYQINLGIFRLLEKKNITTIVTFSFCNNSNISFFVSISKFEVDSSKSIISGLESRDLINAIFCI